jgi:hypothetical protein
MEKMIHSPLDTDEKMSLHRFATVIKEAIGLLPIKLLSEAFNIFYLSYKFDLK